MQRLIKRLFKRLAAFRDKAFMPSLLNLVRVAYDIRCIEKYGRRADSNSVVFRVLAAVETLLYKERSCQAEPGAPR